MLRRSGAFRSGAVALLAAFAILAGRAEGQSIGAAGAPQNLQLAVTINGIPVNMIGSFVLVKGRRIGATVSELNELGLDIDPARFRGPLIMLDEIPSLKYRYDERTQSLEISVDDASRRGQTIDLSAGANPATDPLAPSFGAVLNYDIFANSGRLSELSPFTTGASSIAIDGRAFSPFGTIEQSGIATLAEDGTATATRLNSDFRLSDPRNLVTYTAGDMISGGLAWSRPIRLGGLQAQSNFALRPDLITTPMLSLGGIAAVPSTVDVLINDSRAFSGDVAPGPFTLDNVPITNGAGTAQLIVRDAAGREQVTTVPFFSSPGLLRPGLNEWSVEAGFPRLGYGSGADVYSPALVGSATLRHGISNWLTAEVHAEGGAARITVENENDPR